MRVLLLKRGLIRDLCYVKMSSGVTQETPCCRSVWILSTPFRFRILINSDKTLFSTSLMSSSIILNNIFTYFVHSNRDSISLSGFLVSSFRSFSGCVYV